MTAPNNLNELQNVKGEEGKRYISPDVISFELNPHNGKDHLKVHVKQNSDFLSDDFTVEDASGKTHQRGKQYKGWTYTGNAKDSKGEEYFASFTGFFGLNGIINKGGKQYDVKAKYDERDEHGASAGILPVEIMEKLETPRGICGVKK
ncbi:uncharacterized protein LOC135923108 [Gordionus sp. m RMFG-2023]|uniref:uncharacterized protein LOC135923108 n=1 Tax=Gordionus sp. m RMFG-2023 TaxID=3053472 RepID=UPI0031FC7A39